MGKFFNWEDFGILIKDFFDPIHYKKLKQTMGNFCFSEFCEKINEKGILDSFVEDKKIFGVEKYLKCLCFSVESESINLSINFLSLKMVCFESKLNFFWNMKKIIDLRKWMNFNSKPEKYFLGFFQVNEYKDMGCLDILGYFSLNYLIKIT